MDPLIAKDYIEGCLKIKTKSGEVTLADLMYYMYEHFGEKADLEIIHQHEY